VKARAYVVAAARRIGSPRAWWVLAFVVAMVLTVLIYWRTGDASATVGALVVVFLFVRIWVRYR
jgi:hypothetical protein